MVQGVPCTVKDRRGLHNGTIAAVGKRFTGPLVVLVYCCVELYMYGISMFKLYVREKETSKPNAHIQSRAMKYRKTTERVLNRILIWHIQ